MSRRPSISIYNYPEDLNPFNDDTKAAPTTAITGTNQMAPEGKNSGKESKHKFWTFGRSKKKQRSNSFSIKSSWNGLFGKRKETQEVEIRKPTITTVSSTYQRGTYNGYPTTPVRLSKDQQEFDEALGTLARRRKYTMDNSSRYSSTLTVNGDPGRIYEGTPQDTTTSIMGDLTPKAPARRFGQISPKPTDKLPPLDYSGKESTGNGNVLYDRTPNRTPVPPKRAGPRASQRSLASASLNDDISSPSDNVTLRDENENVPEDYVFKRCSQDVIRKSNLSINSCVSIGSTASAYGRKKRRAPQPPRLKEPLETPKEIDVRPSGIDETNAELQIVESIDIARVTENIDEMTKRSREMDDSPVETSTTENKEEEIECKIENERSASPSRETTDDVPKVIEDKTEKEESVSPSRETIDDVPKVIEDKTEEEESVCPSREMIDDVPKAVERKGSKVRKSLTETESATSSATTDEKCTKEVRIIPREEISKVEDTIEPKFEVELRRKSDSKIELMTDAENYSTREDLPLKRRKSSGNLSRSDSFSVKEEIEKIERQIKLLEAINATQDPNDEIADEESYERGGTRMSLRETRKNFFRNMVDESRVKVELKELPREQNDIRIVRIDEPPVPVAGPTEPVKIIELHISEPIRQKPSIIGEHEVNPIPKPRRHSNLEIECKESRAKVKREEEDDEKRGNSL